MNYVVVWQARGDGDWWQLTHPPPGYLTPYFKTKEAAEKYRNQRQIIVGRTDVEYRVMPLVPPAEERI
jgi:hypothetical protein